MPTPAQLTAVTALTRFAPFQRGLEGLHGNVHIAVGPDGIGTMGGASSPSDPLFWLHHANIDRLWAQWQAITTTARPRNGSETLRPAPIITGKVSATFPPDRPGYSYAG